MQKHPMVSVKEAAVALGCDERWVREKLNQGQLKGEKKSIGMKEKWFVYKGEIDAALAKRGQPITGEPAEDKQYFGVEDEVIDVVDTEVRSQGTGSSLGASLEEVIRLIADQFAEKLEDEKRMNVQLQRELEDKERQLRLLPDLQKQAEEEHKAAELRALEVEALKKQIAAIEAENEELAAKAGEASMLANDLQELKSKVEKMQKPWWKRWLRQASVDGAT